MGLFLLSSKDNDAENCEIAILFVADFEHSGGFHAAGVVK
jgi:hypothetical protein